MLTFTNIFNLEEGSCEVVSMILGSSTPAQRYSSSRWDVPPPPCLNCFNSWNLVSDYILTSFTGSKKCCFFRACIFPIKCFLKRYSFLPQISINWPPLYIQKKFLNHDIPWELRSFEKPSRACLSRSFLSWMAFFLSSIDFRYKYSRRILACRLI